MGFYSDSTYGRINYKKLRHNELIDEVVVEVSDRLYLKPHKVPTRKVIIEIIKAYEELILMYVCNDYLVHTRLGKWMAQRKPGRKKKGLPPQYHPRLNFHTRIKELFLENSDKLDYLRYADHLNDDDPGLMDRVVKVMNGIKPENLD